MTVVPYQGSKIRTKRLAVAGKVTADEAIIGDLKMTGTTNEFQLRNNNLDDNVNNTCLMQLADGETTVGAPASKAIKFTQGGVTRASLGTDGNWVFDRPINVNGVATIIGTQLSTDAFDSTRITNVTSGGDMRFATTDSNSNLVEKVKLQNSGRLIVGHDFTTTPTAPSGSELFHNAGTTRLVGDTTIDGAAILNDGLDVNGNLTVTNGTATVGGVQLGSSGSAGIIFNTTNNGNLRFATSDSNNNLVEKVQLLNSGRLVVGHDFASIPAPPSGSELFHNAGTSRLVGDTTIDGAAILNDGLTLTGEIISNGDIKSGTSNDLVLECQKSNGEIKFLTDTGQKANITSAGALCINTVAPTGTEKLNVNGDVKVTGDVDATTMTIGNRVITTTPLEKLFVHGAVAVLGIFKILEETDGVGERGMATFRALGGDSATTGSVLEIDPLPSGTAGNKGTVDILGKLNVKADTTIKGTLTINKSDDVTVQSKIYTLGTDSGGNDNANTTLVLDPEPFADENNNGTISCRGVLECFRGFRIRGSANLNFHGQVGAVISNLTNDGFIRFLVKDATLNANVDRMRLTNAGRLIIGHDYTGGASDPIGSEKLYVDGDTTLMGNVFIRKANDHTVCATLKVTGSDGDATLIIDPEPFATGSDGTDSDTKPAGGTVVIRGALNVDGATGLPPDGAPPNLVAKLGVAELRSYAFTLAGLPQNSFWIMGHRDLDLNNSSAWFKDAAIAQQATGEVWFASKTASTTNSAPSFRFRDGSIGATGTTVLQYYNSGGSTWAFASDVTVTGEVTINDKLTVSNQPEIHNQLNHIASIGYLKVENYFHNTNGSYMILRNSSLTGHWGQTAALIQGGAGFTYLGSQASQELKFTQGGTDRGKINTDGTWTFLTNVTIDERLIISKDPFSNFIGVGHNTVATNSSPTRSWARKQTLYIRDNGDLYLNGHSGGIIFRHNNVTKATLAQSLMTFNTDVTVTGTFTNSSDDRLKINEQPLLGALSVIRQIKPQSYLKLKDETDLDGSFNVGVIAQELYQIPELQFAVKVPDEPTRMEDNFVKETVQETVTEYEEVTETITEEDLSGNITTREVVTQNPVEVTRDVEKEVNRPYEVTNYWSVDYNALSVYNIAAVKELDSTVRELSGLVLSHKAEIKSLMERIAALEAN